MDTRDGVLSTGNGALSTRDDSLDTRNSALGTKNGVSGIRSNTLNTTTEINRAQKLLNNERTFSPDEVRRILNSDNQEIKRLCKQVCITPKRDRETGRTFFLKNDVEILKKIKDLHEKGQKIMQQNSDSTSLTASRQVLEAGSSADANALVNAVMNVREDIVDRVSKIIDEKLDGMDEVVVELIKCKAENERIKQKLNQLTKDNYKLKNEIESFKPIKFGLYVKNKVVRFGSSNFTLNQ